MHKSSKRVKLAAKIFPRFAYQNNKSSGRGGWPGEYFQSGFSNESVDSLRWAAFCGKYVTMPRKKSKIRNDFDEVIDGQSSLLSMPWSWFNRRNMQEIAPDPTLPSYDDPQFLTKELILLSQIFPLKQKSYKARKRLMISTDNLTTHPKFTMYWTHAHIYKPLSMKKS